MEIIWIILLLIGLFIIICIFGVAGRILGILADLFMNVVSRGCGNCLGCLFWTFVAFIMGIALIQTLLDAL